MFRIVNSVFRAVFDLLFKCKWSPGCASLLNGDDIYGLKMFKVLYSMRFQENSCQNDACVQLFILVVSVDIAFF